MTGDWRNFVLPIGLVAAAEIGLAVSGFQSDNVARPSEIARALGAGIADLTIPVATMETLTSAIGGLAIGGAMGLVLGIALGLFPILARLLNVSIEAMRPIPSVALIPVSLLIFGYGYPMEMAVVAFATFWPMTIYCKAAIESVEPRLLEVSRALQFNLVQSVWKIVIPAALPRIFVAVRIATGIALIIAVTVEITTNPQGLGYSLMSAQQALQPDLMFAKLFWLGIVGVALNYGLLWMQRTLFGTAGNTGVAR